ncbi:MAG TPA: site-2 protease family protein, partial [Candidatus Paceibacterota bacterium]|nr:site-2 protease family protein [Candidatus Paceibacterota bacterium]
MALLIFIIILVALVWVHELGHFSVAKMFGVRVDEFAIGFPPRILSVQWGETRYSFNLVLVGGYVRIFGEEAGEGGNDSRALTSKNRAVQAAVMLAGIAFNLIFAWLALSAGYMAGLPASPNDNTFGSVTSAAVTIVAVLPGSPADEVGVKAGDAIESIQTATATLTPAVGTNGAQVQDFIAQHQDESFVFSIKRNNQTQTVLVRAKEGIAPDRKAIGIQMGDVGILKLPVHLALLQGAVAFKDLTVATAQGLGSFFGKIFVGHADFSQ